MIGNIIGNLYVITLGLEIEIELVSLDGSFDGSNNGILERLFLGDSLGYIYGKVLGSDEGIKVVSTDGKVLGTIPINADGITLGIDFGTDLGY